MAISSKRVASEMTDDWISVCPFWTGQQIPTSTLSLRPDHAMTSPSRAMQCPLPVEGDAPVPPIISSPPPSPSPEPEALHEPPSSDPAFTAEELATIAAVEAAEKQRLSFERSLAGPSVGKAGGLGDVYLADRTGLVRNQTEINRIIAEASKGSKCVAFPTQLASCIV